MSVRDQLSDARYRMELGHDQLIALIVEVGIRLTHYKDIEADHRLLRMRRGMPHEMYSLMRHVVGATRAVTRLRRIVRSYRRSRAAARDGQSTSSNSDASHDRSPRIAPNEHEPPLASSSSHHGDEAGPSATSSQQPAASISTSHDHHEQAGPSTAKAGLVLLTEHSSTTTTTHIDVVLPPVDASISTSDHDHEEAS